MYLKHQIIGQNIGPGNLNSAIYINSPPSTFLGETAVPMGHQIIGQNIGHNIGFDSMVNRNTIGSLVGSTLNYGLEKGFFNSGPTIPGVSITGKQAANCLTGVGLTIGTISALTQPTLAGKLHDIGTTWLPFALKGVGVPGPLATLATHTFDWATYNIPYALMTQNIQWPTYQQFSTGNTYYTHGEYSFQHQGQPMTHSFTTISTPYSKTHVQSWITVTLEPDGTQVTHTTTRMYSQYSSEGLDNAGGQLPSDPGGVLFDVATSTDIKDISGAYWDDEKQQLILVGSKSKNEHEMAVPRLNRDHLVVAVRSALAGQPLGVSIDPPKEWREGKNINDPMPEGMPLIVSYLGNTQGTEFGRIMFEADRLMKCLGVGKDNETQQTVIAHVPGFKTHLEMLEPGKRTGPNWYRFWFVIDKVELKKNTSGDAIAFGDAKIKVLTETQYQSGEKAAVSDPHAEEFARHLTEHYDEYAKEFPVLEKLKELAKIAALAKYISNNIPYLDIKRLLGYQPQRYIFLFNLDNGVEKEFKRTKVSRKLRNVFDANKCKLSHEAKIKDVDNATWEIDDKKDIYLVRKGFGYLNVYQRIHTQETTPGFTTWGKSLYVGNIRHTVGLFGGVDFNVDYDTVIDNHATNKLRREAENSRSLETAVQWDFKDQAGEEKRAIGITIGKLSDSFTTSCCDLRLSQNNGMPLEIQRIYNSLNFQKGELGIGWQLFMPYRLIITPKSEKRKAVLTTFEQREDKSSPPIILINGSTGECQQYRSVETLSPQGFETYYPVTECKITKNGVSFNYTPTNPIRKFEDGYEFIAGDRVTYLFDTQGHLISIFKGGQKCVSYEYDGDFLSHIYGLNGEKILFIHDQNGRIKQIRSWNGTIIDYNYDDNENLILVRDNHNNGFKYFYDADGLLIEEKDLSNNLVQRISYDNFGRIENKRETTIDVGNDETVKKIYNKKHWLETERDNKGNMALYGYDTRGNSNQVILSDKSGNKMRLLYNSEGQLTKILNEFGDFINFKYENDHIKQIQDSYGKASEIVYDMGGITRKMLDAEGNIWIEKIDSNKHQKIITDPNGESTIIDFDENNIVSISNKDEKIEPTLTKSGYVISYFYKNKRQSRIKQNDWGDIVEINNNKNCLKFDYNDMRLIHSIKDNHGEVCRFDYETEGDEIVMTAKFQCFSKGELYGFKPNGDKHKEKSEKTNQEKTCPHCNSLNPLDAKFCVICGKPFPKNLLCPNCGKEVDEQWVICPVCETPLSFSNDNMKVKTKLIFPDKSEKEISEDELLIGREDFEECVKNGVITADEFRYISRRIKPQFKILREDGKFYILDENSTGGTWLNDKMIEKDKKIKLNNNDKIIVAGVKSTKIIYRRYDMNNVRKHGGVR